MRASDSLRCGSRIVSPDAIMASVRAACGEPSYRDVWNYFDDGYAHRVGDSEAWTYNFGPNQLLRILRFRNGRLHSIETDGYGFYAADDGRCSAGDIVIGYSKYRLAAVCGEPVDKRAIGYLQPYRPSGEPEQLFPSGSLLTPAYREEWTYNFGASAFLRRVILENGRVVDIQNGERGFDDAH